MASNHFLRLCWIIVNLIDRDWLQSIAIKKYYCCWQKLLLKISSVKSRPFITLQMMVTSLLIFISFVTKPSVGTIKPPNQRHWRINYLTPDTWNKVWIRSLFWIADAFQRGHTLPSVKFQSNLITKKVRNICVESIHIILGYGIVAL